jgi:DNA-binding transcriptional ArsR family regulator
MFNGFSDLSRLKLLYLLKDQPLSVNQLVEKSELSQPNVSNHLRCLRDCNLVTARRTGREVHYELAYPEILDLLLVADRILDTTYSSLAACVNYEVEESS